MTSLKKLILICENNWGLFYFAAAGLVLGTAYIFQYGFGYPPCELCYYQRYPYMLVMAVGLLAFFARHQLDIATRRAARGFLIMIIALLFLNAFIAFYHIGIEQGWWQGFTTCTVPFDPKANAEQTLESIMKATPVRCDEPAWTLFGISMAGYNMIAALVLAFFGIHIYRKYN